MTAFEEGMRALAQERIDLAVERLSLATAEAPDDAMVHAFLASALFAAARPDASARAIDRSIELGPEEYWPNLKAGELRLRLGDATTAVEHFLVGGVVPAQKVGDLAVHVPDGLRHAFATPRRPAVAQLHGLVDAGRGARRDDRPASCA